MNDTQPLTVPLELTLEDIVWLRSFLSQERDAANVDRQKAEALHNSLASRAAVHVLNSECETMTRIIDEICRVVNMADAHDALARRIAAMAPTTQVN
jgi:hypothetical protein